MTVSLIIRETVIFTTQSLYVKGAGRRVTPQLGNSNYSQNLDLSQWLLSPVKMVNTSGLNFFGIFFVNTAIIPKMHVLIPFQDKLSGETPKSVTFV